MNINLLSSVFADSGLEAIGSLVVEQWAAEPVAPFTFVPASEEWLRLDAPRHLTTLAKGEAEDEGCQCCCCTGECRDYDYEECYDDYELEPQDEVRFGVAFVTG
jgi:hypothetical protein